MPPPPLTRNNNLQNDLFCKFQFTNSAKTVKAISLILGGLKRSQRITK